mmetsp:Transcript_21290/g.25620  ORF Transcript_21290/g.25620 Transcript_21290/m.25620 type:complete len:431 (-) Transcript_21290:764-2056(-)
MRPFVHLLTITTCCFVTVAAQEGPTLFPALVPTSVPISSTTSNPTLAPTPKPTSCPTAVPTPEPTNIPTLFPTSCPTALPTPEPKKKKSGPTIDPAVIAVPVVIGFLLLVAVLIWLYYRRNLPNNLKEASKEDEISEQEIVRLPVNQNVYQQHYFVQQQVPPGAMAIQGHDVTYQAGTQPSAMSNVVTYRMDDIIDQFKFIRRDAETAFLQLKDHIVGELGITSNGEQFAFIVYSIIKTCDEQMQSRFHTLNRQEVLKYMSTYAKGMPCTALLTALSLHGLDASATQNELFDSVSALYNIDWNHWSQVIMMRRNMSKDLLAECKYNFASALSLIGNIQLRRVMYNQSREKEDNLMYFNHDKIGAETQFISSTMRLFQPNPKVMPNDRVWVLFPSIQLLEFKSTLIVTDFPVNISKQSATIIEAIDISLSN